MRGSINGARRSCIRRILLPSLLNGPYFFLSLPILFKYRFENNKYNPEKGMITDAEIKATLGSRKKTVKITERVKSISMNKLKNPLKLFY